MTNIPTVSYHLDIGQLVAPGGDDAAARQSALNRIFQITDTDHDGVLAKSEVEAVVSGTGGQGGRVDADALYDRLSDGDTQAVDKERFLSSFPGSGLNGPTLYLLATTKDMTD
jgi:hypothetical protein